MTVLLSEHDWQSLQQLHPVQLHSLHSSSEQHSLLFLHLQETASMTLTANGIINLTIFILIFIGLWLIKPSTNITIILLESEQIKKIVIFATQIIQ